MLLHLEGSGKTASPPCCLVQSGTGAASLSTLLLFVEVPHEKIPEVVLEDVVLENEKACVCA
jgi:hypothetical protein